MYRLRMPPQNLRRLLLDYVSRIEILAAQPAWYNSVTSNCTTNLFYHRHANVPWWLKPNIFLNGLSARAMYRLGFWTTVYRTENCKHAARFASGPWPPATPQISLSKFARRL